MAIILVLLIVAVLVALYYHYEKGKQLDLQKNGIKVSGVAIKNSEYRPRDNNRLGGNINRPTVQFTTKDGKEITGKPIVGYISQHELQPPFEVAVIYDKNDPHRFLLDI